MIRWTTQGIQIIKPQKLTNIDRTHDLMRAGHGGRLPSSEKQRYFGRFDAHMEMEPPVARDARGFQTNPSCWGTNQKPLFLLIKGLGNWELAQLKSKGPGRTCGMDQVFSSWRKETKGGRQECKTEQSRRGVRYCTEVEVTDADTRCQNGPEPGLGRGPGCSIICSRRVVVLLHACLCVGLLWSRRSRLTGNYYFRPTSGCSQKVLK